MANNFNFIDTQLSQQKVANRYRQRACVSGDKTSVASEITVAGKHYINFSSNDYLGLNNHPEINKAFHEGIDKFGSCASASSLVTGFHYAHQTLENEICQWLNKPRCLLFSSGFSANTALFNALGNANQSTHFYLDKLSHASMIDGAYQSKAQVKRFTHNNTEQLNRLLTNTTRENTLIASEGIFSMDGDQAPVTELASLATAHKAWLYLDDAHSIGVIGKKGEGSNSHTAIDITMATFGKAIATSGAFITCEANLHDYLINFARHYIYSTAISPALAWATVKSIQLIQQEQWRRDKIKHLSALFSELLSPSIKLISSQSSIHAIVIGDEKSTLSVSNLLKAQGIWLTAIRPPTVAMGSSRLRVTICSHHNESQIRYLAECLNRALA